MQASSSSLREATACVPRLKTPAGGSSQTDHHGSPVPAFSGRPERPRRLVHPRRDRGGPRDAQTGADVPDQPSVWPVPRQCRAAGSVHPRPQSRLCGGGARHLDLGVLGVSLRAARDRALLFAGADLDPEPDVLHPVELLLLWRRHLADPALGFDDPAARLLLSRQGAAAAADRAGDVRREFRGVLAGLDDRACLGAEAGLCGAAGSGPGLDRRGFALCRR